MFYFERLGPHQFRSSEHVGGAWNTAEQHIAPSLGLIAHAIEQAHAAGRTEPWKLARLSFDILGPLPMGIVDVEVTSIRPGRTIELLEARLSCAGRACVLARGWMLQAFDTAAIGGSALAAIPGPDDMTPWRPDTIWPGAFVKTIAVRKTVMDLGRAVSWIRTEHDLIAGEPVSPTAAAIGILDMANGLAPRVGFEAAAFPNVDFTVHLFAEPQGAWLGLDTQVSFGGYGVGLVHSTIHDSSGPIGTVAQCLTVRPR